MLIIYFLVADEVRKKWTNLRDYFRKQLKDVKGKKSGQAASKKKRWVFFERMSFLIPYMQPREMSGNLDTISTASDTQQSISDEETESNVTQTQNITSAYEALPSASAMRWPSGKKRKDDNEIEKDILKALQDDDEDEHFFKSCLPIVENENGRKNAISPFCPGAAFKQEQWYGHKEPDHGRQSTQTEVTPQQYYTNPGNALNYELHGRLASDN